VIALTRAGELELVFGSQESVWAMSDLERKKLLKSLYNESVFQNFKRVESKNFGNKNQVRS